jgi:hypothetical protein
MLVAYAHIRLRYHSATRFQAELTRVLLLLIGVWVGWLVLRWQTDAPVLIVYSYQFITDYFFHRGLLFSSPRYETQTKIAHKISRVGIRRLCLRFPLPLFHPAPPYHGA